MHPFWSPMAEQALPYTPGEQPQDQQYIKLNTNECPYPPTPWLNQLDFAAEKLRLYPDPTAENLRSILAARAQLDVNEVFVGNGSDEILAFTFMALMDKEIAHPNISYSFYPVYARLFKLQEHIVPLREKFELNLKDYDALEGPVIIANPNAPTGLAISVQDMVEFLTRHPQRLLIVDEAYVDFGAQSMVPYIHQYPNLLIIQTFSKSRALAGARLGFAMGQAHLIEALERIKNSFNSYTISRFTLKAGAMAVLDEEYFQWTCTQIRETRDQLIAELRQHAIEVTDSKANFLWLRCPEFTGHQLYQRLREKGILVRHFNQPLIEDYIRVTIGTKNEMEQFKRKLFEVLLN